MKSNVFYPRESDFEFLTSDKSSWFEVDEYGYQRWNKNKVDEFWTLFYEIHKDSDEFLFTDYQFPPIAGDGFLCFKIREIDFPVVFNNCKFWGKFEIKNLVFKEAVSFSDSLFFDRVEFDNITFKDRTWFDFVNFDNVSYFDNVIFENKCYFSKATFNNVSFTDIEFNDKACFDRSVIVKAFFRNVNFGTCIFDRINMFDKGFNHYTASPEVRFRDIDFPLSAKFFAFDFSNTNFWNCDLRDINLKRCKFNKIGTRVIFPKENLSLLGYEEVYRDLKRNFYEKKDWETSGCFYTSEMKVRTKRLLKERKYLEWFIYWFYGFFGGYTQNFKKPLMLFLLFTFYFFNFSNDLLFF